MGNSYYSCLKYQIALGVWGIKYFYRYSLFLTKQTISSLPLYLSPMLLCTEAIHFMIAKHKRNSR